MKQLILILGLTLVSPLNASSQVVTSYDEYGTIDVVLVYTDIDVYINAETKKLTAVLTSPDQSLQTYTLDIWDPNSGDKCSHLKALSENGTRCIVSVCGDHDYMVITFGDGSQITHEDVTFHLL